ncbi:hypothetical protein Nepgr_030845 [Nepenthes gracilis]|uniref:Uncharacterized protein n=1 Tax=Nepenthes gracilis TaxID=150966 RepID=A0AAD3TGI9_NEPGR|nr:hypothetical protein Nepgr_030845 [Nepenthes gracilis]
MKNFRPTGKILPNPFTSKSLAARQDKKDLSKQHASLYGQPTDVPSCSANPLAPLQVDDGSLGSAMVDHSDLELQSFNTNEDALEETPASCSSPTATSLGLSTAINEKAPSNTLIDCSQVDIDLEQHNEASDVHLTCLGRPDPGSDHGHAPDLVVNDQPTSIGYQDIQNPLVTQIHTLGSCQQEDISKIWHHDAEAVFVNPCSCRHDPGSAPGQPTAIDADWLDTLRISNCPEEVIGFPTFSSLAHVVLSYPQGGDPRPCTHSEQLRRNLTDMRQQLVAPRGFGLKSILKKPKQPKKKWSPSSTHHV